MFLARVVAEQQLPFVLKAPIADTRAAMEEARTIGKARSVSAKNLIVDLEKGAKRYARGLAAGVGSNLVRRNELDDAAFNFGDSVPEFFVPGRIDLWPEAAFDRSDQFLCEPGSILGGKRAHSGNSTTTSVMAQLHGGVAVSPAGFELQGTRSACDVCQQKPLIATDLRPMAPRRAMFDTSIR